MKIKILALSVFSILATQNAISQTTKQDVVMTEKKMLTLIFGWKM